MTWQFQVPADGSSIAVEDFAKSADELSKDVLADESDDAKAQLEAALKAAKTLVKADLVGGPHVYVSISGHADKASGASPGAAPSALVIGIYQRQSPAAASAALGPPPVVAEPVTGAS